MRFLPIILLVLTFFYPKTGSYIYLGFVIIIELYILFLNIIKRPLNHSIFLNKLNLSSQELKIYSKYYIFYRYRLTSIFLSAMFTSVMFTSIILIPWVIIKVDYITAAIILINIPFAYKLTHILNPIHFANTPSTIKITHEKHLINSVNDKLLKFNMPSQNESKDKSKNVKRNQTENLIEYSSFIDHRDGNEYKTVKIGEQIWLAENLRYIPHVSPVFEDGGIWVYNYNGSDINEALATENYKNFGCLYDWNTAKKICPIGYHVPSDEEWAILIDYLGGRGVAGDKMKSLNYWYNQNTHAKNESGFSGLAGGYRDRGEFGFIGKFGSWICSTEIQDDNAWNRTIGFNGSEVYRDACLKTNGYSLRCIKD
jgi:uncharacterized protein (TIGR02145 family)